MFAIAAGGVPADSRRPGGPKGGLGAWQNGDMKRTTEVRQATPNTGWPARSRQRVTVPARTAAAFAAGLLTTVLLASCAGGSPAVPGPAATGSAAGPSTNETGPAAATEQKTAGPSGSSPSADPATTDMKQTVADALNRLAAGSPKPATAQMTDALTGAGVAPAALEVSASRTPTGLAADAIESAVLQGTDCVFGHIRDGSVTVTVLPVLASGKCFVGSGS